MVTRSDRAGPLPVGLIADTHNLLRSIAELRVDGSDVSVRFAEIETQAASACRR